jgi:hypothetical protein
MDLSSQRPGSVPGDSHHQALSWWLHPGSLRKEIESSSGRGSIERCYRFGSGFLRLTAHDPLLDERFADLYGECAVEAAEADPASTVGCVVRLHDERPLAMVSFEDPEPLNATGLYQLLFEEWGFRMHGAEQAGWWTLAFNLEPDLPLAAGSSQHFLFDSNQIWQPLAGQLALNRVLMLQRRSLFFHAAALSIGGAGVILAGGKGQGKTTLSLALAARGHGWLGDEVAAVSTGSWSLLPFRRSASIRRGPASAAVADRLAAGKYPEEKHPDGSLRTRVRIGELFPDAAAGEVPLKALFVLLGRETPARVERIAPRREHLVRLPILRCTMWEMPVARRFLALTRTLASVALFHLHPGDPDESADLIERTMEELGR